MKPSDDIRLKDETKSRTETADKYRMLFESSMDAIMLADENGFFDCNKATLRLFG